MKVHIDWPWTEDARYGAPFRAYINRGRKGFWIVALWPGHKTQVYDRRTQTYTDRWGWIVYRPPLKEKENEPT